MTTTYSSTQILEGYTRLATMRMRSKTPIATFWFEWKPEIHDGKVAVVHDAGLQLKATPAVVASYQLYHGGKSVLDDPLAWVLYSGSLGFRDSSSSIPLAPSPLLDSAIDSGFINDHVLLAGAHCTLEVQAQRLGYGGVFTLVGCAVVLHTNGSEPGPGSDTRLILKGPTKLLLQGLRLWPNGAWFLKLD